MQLKIKLWFLFLAALLLNGCEDVIQINLKGVEPQLVIEGTMVLKPGSGKVRISKTTDYFDPSVYPPVSGAVVEIRDDMGNMESLQEQEPGLYKTQILTGDTGKIYSLRVLIEGKEFNASSTMESVVPLDSIKTEYIPGGGFREDGYYLHCFFTDPKEKGNNYRLVAYVNGVEDETIYLVDDTFINGRVVDFLIFFASYQIGDTAMVELQSVDRPVFEYLNTLNEITTNQGGNNPANPANPNSNISGGALGYFGALAKDIDTVLIKN